MRTLEATRRRARRRGILGAILGALLLAGCGGRTALSAGAGEGGADAIADDTGLDSGPADATADSTPDASPHDAGLDAGPPCPTVTPSQGAACAEVGQGCQYGTNVIETCIQVADCTPGGWSVTGPANGCLAAGCPSAFFMDASAGVPPCPPSLESTDCWYPEGVCQCSAGLGGPVMPLGWYCEPTAAGCPYPTPPPGTGCATPGQLCGGFCGGTGVVCDAGAWQTNDSPCPV